MPERPRILVLEDSTHTAGNLLHDSQPDWDIVRAENPSQGLALLRSERFDGIYADTHDPTVWARAENLLQAERILEALADSVTAVPDTVLPDEGAVMETVGAVISALFTVTDKGGEDVVWLPAASRATAVSV